jgi:hypothetical protein
MSYRKTNGWTGWFHYQELLENKQIRISGGKEKDDDNKNKKRRTLGVIFSVFVFAVWCVGQTWRKCAVVVGRIGNVFIRKTYWQQMFQFFQKNIRKPKGKWSPKMNPVSSRCNNKSSLILSSIPLNISISKIVLDNSWQKKTITFCGRIETARRRIGWRIWRSATT